MGLFSRKKREPVILEGRQELCVVGESHCQDAIESIAGPKEERGKCLAVLATLVCDTKNAYDANAVGVYVDGKRVGYLPREVAADVSPRLASRRAPCVVRAQINGGWDNGHGDVGFFGVVLYMPDVDDI